MTASKNILIVDDEEDLAWAISKSLTKSSRNLNIESARSVDEALAELSKKHFELVVTDIQMPGRDGLQLVSDIRKNYPHTKVIIMTAYGSSRVRDRVEDFGGFFYIEKPFEVGYLKQIVFEALGLDDNGFKGFIENAGIRELVQYNCIRRRESALILTNNSESAKICFKNGDIIHAECGELKGEEAFYNILNWGKGTFKIAPGPLKTSRTIIRDWKTLLHQCV